MRARFWPRLALVAPFAASFANVAAAHPHVWITGQEQVIFGPKGEIDAIRHAWVFDEMYSAFVTEGVGKKGQILTKDDLAPLAKSNVEDLAEFDYFTHAKLQERQSRVRRADRLFAGGEAGQARRVALHHAAEDAGDGETVFLSGL